MSLETDQDKNKLIAKNTVLLYFRTILVLLVSLFTSRVVLNTLGVKDFGVFQAVGGVVTVFSVISGAMSNSISRFITFEIGRGNKEVLEKTFATSVVVQLVISFIILLLCEILGVWFLNHKMDIPDGRLEAANWVLQCSLLTFILGLISIPYNACIIAHERMNAFAYISIAEAILKLLIVYMLLISPFDKLKTYSILLVVVAIFIRFLYVFYCHKNFEESRTKLIYDKTIFKSMLGFAGWNFFSNITYIINTQGISLLVNVYFGVALNAARGLATQVDSAVMQFVGNFTMAINPQITKTYASNNKERMFNLICKGAKFSFFLLLIFSLPVLFETEYILRLWLKIVPDYTVIFVRLAFIGSMITCLGTTGYTACMATGNIRKYVIWITTTGTLVFFLTWIAYYLQAPVETTYYIYIIIYIIIQIIRLLIMRELLDFPITIFVKDVILKIFPPTALSLILPFVIIYSMNSSFMRLIICSLCCVISSCMFIFLIGLTKGEKNIAIHKIKSFIKK